MNERYAKYKDYTLRPRFLLYPFYLLGVAGINFTSRFALYNYDHYFDLISKDARHCDKCGSDWIGSHSCSSSYGTLFHT